MWDMSKSDMDRMVPYLEMTKSSIALHEDEDAATVTFHNGDTVTIRGKYSVAMFDMLVDAMLEYYGLE